MLSDVRKAIEAIVQGRIGDAGVYKSLALGVVASPATAAALATLAESLPVIELDALRVLPDGAFGRAYADHMDRFHLMPLKVSPGCRADIAGRAALGPRYTLFHDAFHVLLGCDTSLEGECEVWAFVAAQDYGPAFQKAGLASLVSYTLARPWRWRALREAYLRGRARGRRAAKLLALPLETLWPRPLAAVREELGLA